MLLVSAEKKTRFIHGSIVEPTAATRYGGAMHIIQVHI